MPVKPDILKVTATARSRLFQVEELELRFSNGVERTYERLASRGNGAVMMIPLNADNELLLIREYAAGMEDYVLTLPKGVIDPGESAEQAADRELKEEIGFGCRQLDLLKVMSTAPNYMGHRLTAYIARDLYPCRLEGDEPEELEVVRWPLAQLSELLHSEQLHEARVIAALYLMQDILAGEAG